MINVDTPVRYRVSYAIGRLICRGLARKYEFETDEIPETGEPYILVSNHLTESDQIFAILGSPRPIYFVCGEHLLRNKLYGKPLKLLADPIPVEKGKSSLSAVREMIRRVRAGRSVMIFPEGRRSYHGRTLPQPEALGKFIRQAGCTLVTYRLTGGFFVQARWSRKKRRGPVKGRVVGVYTSDELKAMTPAQITEIVNRDIRSDAYAEQRKLMWTYEGGDPAEGMEKYLFKCPVCGAYDRMWAKGDEFGCSACGMKGRIDEHGFLVGTAPGAKHPDAPASGTAPGSATTDATATSAATESTPDTASLPFDNTYDWTRWMEKEFDRYVEESGDKLLFTEKAATLFEKDDNYKDVDLATCDVELYRDRMVMGDRVFRFKEIPSLTIIYSDVMFFTHGGVYYGMKGDLFHAWKCARLWQLEQGIADDPTREI